MSGRACGECSLEISRAMPCPAQRLARADTHPVVVVDCGRSTACAELRPCGSFIARGGPKASVVSDACVGSRACARLLAFAGHMPRRTQWDTRALQPLVSYGRLPWPSPSIPCHLSSLAHTTRTPCRSMQQNYPPPTRPNIAPLVVVACVSCSAPWATAWAALPAIRGCSVVCSLVARHRRRCRGSRFFSMRYHELWALAGNMRQNKRQCQCISSVAHLIGACAMWADILCGPIASVAATPRGSMPSSKSVSSRTERCGVVAAPRVLRRRHSLRLRSELYNPCTGLGGQLEVEEHGLLVAARSSSSSFGLVLLYGAAEGGLACTEQPLSELR